MATDGHIESVHQVANGKIHAPLGHGRFFFQSHFISNFYLKLSLNFIIIVGNKTMLIHLLVK